ncbi:MAG: hypothetical protein Kow0042_22090 [Calditrichia bacterium]
MEYLNQFRHFKKTAVTLLVLVVALLAYISFIWGKEAEDEKKKSSPYPPRLEMPDDPYLPVPREGRETSPAYRFSASGFFTTQVNVLDTNLNIIGDAANEPSIAIDPGNPNRMVIGWRQFDTINSNFRQAGYAFTTDGGQTWTFPGVIDPGVFRSDPVLDSDSAGTFYYNSLTVLGGNFACHVFKSSDGGNTWDMGTFARGGDKQWMVIDKTGGISEGHIYSYWTPNYSVCYPGFFIRSANHGISYENCVIIPGSPFWGTLAVASDGKLFVGGATETAFLVARSSNARDSSQVVSWDLSTIVDLDGTIEFANGPNPGGLLGQTWIAVDPSSGPNQGNVYLLCSVKRASISDPLDIMFSRSSDEGQTWSPPVRINDDPGTNAWQWFGTMSVAPNGRIDVVWLDTRDNPGTFLSSLYYSYSLDGGLTWAPNERLSPAFDPYVGWPQQNKMGDYFHMISDDSSAHLAWAATFNGEQDVYYARITPSPVVGVRQENKTSLSEKFILYQNYPNPFNPTTTIEFALPQGGFVSLKIYNILGEEVAMLVSERLAAGKYKYNWNATGLANGVYFYRLKTDKGFQQIRKLILLK